MRQTGFIGLLGVVALVAGAAPLAAKDDSETSLLDVVVGDYAVVGQEPDGTGLFGLGHDWPREGSITLNERRGDHELTATGTVEASSPGERRVLRLHWQTAAP